MRAEDALRALVPRFSVERGEQYYITGRVTLFDEVSGGRFEATVLGGHPYRVVLEPDGDFLRVSCECPFFDRELDVCKHIWAVIRSASTRGLLPDRKMYPLPEPGGGDIVARQAGPRPKRAPQPEWQRFLQALGPAPQASHMTPRSVPDEIAYVITPTSGAHSLLLRLLGRARRKNGEWGKWKPLSFRLDDLQSLDPFDRESIALLNQHSYGYSTESSIVITPATTAWWIERLAGAGRLVDAEMHPIAWDDGPPWTFRVAIASEGATYRISGSVERENATLPLDDIDAIANGIVISNGRAAHFDDGGRAPWLRALRASGSVEVPHADAERFRQALLRAPIAGITLPEELGWELVEETPHPVLALQRDEWMSELLGEAYFVYDEWRVSSRSSEPQKSAGRKLIRRNRVAEDVYRGRLVALGAIATREGYRVRLSHLEQLVRTLRNEGWSIEIDSAPLRTSDELEVELSSGIDWFDLNLSATFGETKLALPELLAAAEARRAIVRLADGSMGIVPQQWYDKLAPVMELGKREGNTLRFKPHQTLVVDALLETRTRREFPEPKPQHEPPTLRAELREYQRAGLGWLLFLRESRLGGVLADDMGLGKTVQALALLESIRGGKKPSLVVAPRSLLFNWAAEAARFAPQLRIREHHGTDRAKDNFEDCDVVLTTYATMRLDIAHFAEVEFEYAILDEAQAIKNATSQVAKASRQLNARHRLALSGTPIENHLGELWSLFEFLNPGLLGTSRWFSRTFGAKTTPPERRDALARALRPLILRRTKEQVAPELPERTEQTLYCELEPKQRRIYDELRDHYRASLLGGVRARGIDKSRMLILEALLRLRQAACDPKLIDPRSDSPSAKSELLMEELRDVLESGHRALIFSQFTSFLAIVRGALSREGIRHLYLDGKTRDRQSLVEEFQSDAGPPLFLISLKAGGLGLNLTNADYIFLLDPWWNPAVEAQAIDRAHRIGRLRPVVAYRLIARDTVEEKILELQSRKRELAESIISEDNSVLRKLEVEDLEMLLS
ncbi:MAG TPA: DEAD/DEAH box helicase [Thermoanaerobaculia bacterium]|nr:DEAD/DEAH box helicase [Thermoanaerobaculia bacterium]